jgi:hypothetical protein
VILHLRAVRLRERLAKPATRVAKAANPNREASNSWSGTAGRFVGPRIRSVASAGS